MKVFKVRNIKTGKWVAQETAMFFYPDSSDNYIIEFGHYYSDKDLEALVRDVVELIGSEDADGIEVKNAGHVIEILKRNGKL